MPLLINTRPAHAPTPVVAGVDVVNLPLLDIVYHDDVDADAHDAMMDLLAGRIPVVLVVSVPAALAGIDFLSAQGVAHADELPVPVQCVAVGDATADVLRCFGFSVSVPDVAQQNNEGMLQLPAIDALSAGDTLMVWQGVGGRTHLKDVLGRRGVYIRAVVWYERRKPSGLADALAGLQSRLSQHDTVYVIISSEHSWISWQSLMVRWHAKRPIYLTLGRRLYDIVGRDCADARILLPDLTDASLACAMTTDLPINTSLL